MFQFQFSNRLENTVCLQQERRKRQARSQQILIGKFEDLKENYASITVEIQSKTDEIGQCLEIISVKVISLRIMEGMRIQIRVDEDGGEAGDRGRRK